MDHASSNHDPAVHRSGVHTGQDHAVHGDRGHHGHAHVHGPHDSTGHGAGHSAGHGGSHRGGASWRTAAQATLHCLTGCAIGEVLGMVIGTALGLHDGVTVALAVALAFLFGYALTIRGVLKAGLTLREALKVALAADTVSILVMEVVDNAVMLAVPGAMDAGLAGPLFWGALAFALAVAFVLTVPVNRWLIARGRGHAVVHAHHH
ncbi:DUF4396 domain-containing protein [Streptomyces atacamensis]|jgi:hypothetical protein|uniref:DUF4396 domain-containing protein n=1 Tax=Streptomyces atacamensis TaxID=531966 RepID=UPI00399C8EDD